MHPRQSKSRALRAAVEVLEVRQLLVGSATGSVYHDLNGNGVRDGGEAGLADRTVFVDANNNLVLDAGEMSAVTDASGNYSLTGLVAGPTSIALAGAATFDHTAPPNGLHRITVVDLQSNAVPAFGSRQRNPKQYLDPSFGSAGETLVNSNGNQFVLGVKELTDGKYVVASMRNGLPVVQRFTAAGAVDTTFGGGTGTVTPILPSGFTIDAVAIAADGRLVLGGHSPAMADFEVAVLRTDGIPDTTFSGDGYQTVDFGNGVDALRDVAVTPDNRIVLLGGGEAGEIQLARLSFSGNLDSSFGNNGRVALNIDASLDVPAGVAVQSNGAILVACSRTLPNNGRNVGVLVRFGTGGALDFTYASGGTRVIDVNSGALTLTDIAIQADDRAIVAGALPLGLMFFSRLNTDGSNDLNFADNGRLTYFPQVGGFPLGSASPRVDVNGTGTIAFAATLTPTLGQPPGTRIGVGILNSIGQLDNRYLRAGELVQSFTGSEGDDLFGDLVVLSDSRVVVAGTAAALVANKLALFRTGGVQPRATVSGNVFNDFNQNGVRDAGEGGASGLSVLIDLNRNGQRDSGEPFSVTDVRGNYAITNLLAGGYSMMLLVPVGFQQTYPGNAAVQLELFPGQNLGAQNFGLHEIPPVITANPGGPYTVGEGGTVQLLGSAQGATITSYSWDFDYDGVTFTEDAIVQNPLFSAANLDGPSTRTVALRARSGSFSSPIATTTLTINNVAPTATFGNNGPVNVGGSATVSFSNQNDPSAADRTAGFKYSYDFGNDGTFEIVDSTSPSATVPANLTASPGTVAVRGQIKDRDGASNDYTTSVSVIIAPPGATIRGTVFLDADRDGNFDLGESGVSGRTIYLDPNNNSQLDPGEVSTTTNSSGVYQFTSLPAGTYKIRQVLPSGFIQTTPANNFGNNATVSGTQLADNEDFGTNTAATPTGATIRGTVFLDADRDGNFDSGEAGVSGRTIYLDPNNNSQLDPGETSTVTNSSGQYEFTNLPAGTYKIRQVLPSGFIQTTPANNFGNNATISGTQVAANENFGTNTALTAGGEIRGTVWNDLDRDGNFDSGEVGISGRIVYIDANNNGVRDSGEASDTTNSAGQYEIAGLPAGTYKVRQILPSGFSQTFPSNNFGNNVTLSTNQTRSGVNFGSAATSSGITGAPGTLTLARTPSITSELFGEEPIA